MHNEVLFNIIEFIVERNPTNIQNITKLLFEHHTLFNTSKFIPVRSLKNVKTVTCFLIKKDAKPTTRKIRVEKLYKCKNVTKLLMENVPFSLAEKSY